MISYIKIHNELSLDKDRKSPLNGFSGVKTEICCDNFHTWVYPLFVLEDAKQSGLTRKPEWKPIVRTVF